MTDEKDHSGYTLTRDPITRLWHHSCSCGFEAVGSRGGAPWKCPRDPDKDGKLFTVAKARAGINY